MELAELNVLTVLIVFLGAMVTAWVALLSWLGRREVARIDALDQVIRTKADRHEIVTSINAMAKKLDAQQATLSATHAAIYARINNDVKERHRLDATLQRLLGALEAKGTLSASG